MPSRLSALSMRRAPSDKLRSLVVLALLFAFPAAASAQTLRGVVMERRSGLPIGDVEVRLRDAVGGGITVRTVRTDQEGRYELRLSAAGTFDVTFRRVGYDPLTVPDVQIARREIRDLAVVLELRPVPLAEVLIAPPPNTRPFFMDGFEQRRRLGIGSFLTRAEIETQGISSLTNVIRGLAGVRVTTRPGRASVTSNPRDMMGVCNLVLFVDGMRASGAQDPPETVFRNFDMIPVSNIEALEGYRGNAQLPSQFAGPDVRCGAVVVWTRRPGLPPPAQAVAPPGEGE